MTIGINQQSADLVYRQVYEMTRRELARRRLLDFAIYTMPKYDPQPFHVKIAETLDLLLAGELRRVILCMPPRHGKSELSSVRLPALFLGQRPDQHIIHASYASSLSNEFSFQVRGIVRDDPRYRELFPQVQVHPERQRVDDWKMIAGGSFRSVGVGAGISGRPADFLDIDDPQKEGDEKSPTTMQDIYDWFISAANLRLSPKGIILVTMTRWSLLDLVGRVTALMVSDPKADQWYMLVLPGVAGSDDPVGRELGAALWPARFSLERLRSIRASSERYFMALFQQEPRGGDSQLFWPQGFRVVDDVLGFFEGGPAWCFDLAITEKDRSDYNVFGRWWLSDEGELSVQYIRRFRSEWPYTKKFIKRLMRLFPNDDFVFPKHMLELMAVQELKSEMPQDAHRIRQVEMRADKVANATVLADRCAGGRVFVERGKYSHHFIQEHVNFPQDAYDDCVDNSSVATHWFGLNKLFDALILRDEEAVGRDDPDMAAFRERFGL